MDLQNTIAAFETFSVDSRTSYSHKQSEMVRFKAVQDELSDSDHEENSTPTHEAARLIIMSKYNEVMKLLSENNLDPMVCCSMLKGLLELFNSQFSSQQANAGEADQKIPYLIYKNLAHYNILAGNIDAALSCYAKAVQLDSSDWMSWKKLGDLAFDCKVSNLRLAEYAYENCLKLRRNFRLCHDRLIQVLWLLEDLPACLIQIYSSLLADPNCLKSLFLRNKIFVENPNLKDWVPDRLKLKDHLSLRFSKCRLPKEKLMLLDNWYSSLKQRRDQLREKNQIGPCPTSISLVECSVKCLGEALLELHVAVSNSGDCEIFSCPIDLQKWMDTTIQTGVATVMDTILSLVDSSLESLDHVSYRRSQDDECNLVSLYDKESLSQEVSCSSIAASSEAESSDVPTVPVENIENDRHHNRTKLKQKEQQPIDFNLLTRRSARRIPGFSLPEDDFFTRYQRPPLPVKEQLLNCFPPAISDQLKSYDSSSGSQVSPVRTEKSLTAIKADRKICHNLEEERRIVEEYLSINDGKCLSDLMCNWLLVVEKTRWHQGWNAEGLVVFLKCYACWKEMVDGWIFDEFSPEHVASNSDLLALLFCEIYFKLKTSGSVDSAVRGLSDLYDKTLGHLNFGFGPMNAAKSLAVRGNQDFFSRLQWLLANVSLVDGKFITGANFARMLVENQTNFRSPFVVLDHQVTQTDVERLSATLQRKMKLKSVREMIADGDLETVGETLSGTIASAKELAEFEDLLEHILSLAEAFVKRNDLNQQLRWLRKGLHLVGQIFAVFPACDAGKFLESLQRLCAKATESINSQATNDINQKELISISKVSMDLALWAVDKSTANVFSGKSVLRSVDLWILIYTTARSTESEYLMDDEYLKEWYSHIGSNKTFLATRSLMILLFAHEQLGKIHSCTGDDGRLLVFFVEEISKCLRDSRLSSLTPSPCRDDMLNVAEQNFFCLYEYPNKRKRHLIDHYAPAAQLTWDRIVTLFDFVKPSEAPEFDDKTGCERSRTISADDEVLLKRIESLIPEHLRPDGCLSSLQQYLCSSQSNAFVQLEQNTMKTPVVSELYHLSADYHLKSTKNYAESERYYMLDLCINRNRFDSWAGLAILKSKQLADKFGLDGASFNETDRKRVLLEGYSCLKCFQNAVDLWEFHGTLWVEYGFTAYQLHSYISRVLQREKHMTHEDRVTLLKQKRQYLCLARTAYEKANQIANDPGMTSEERDQINKEEWLHNYMLGKIAEKTNQKPIKVLEYYQNAMYFLHKEGAKYPEKIRYQNPSKYCLEALEVFYRAHVCVVKWLLAGRHSNLMTKFTERIQIFRNSPLASRELANPHDSLSVGYKARGLSHPDVVKVVDTIVDNVCDSLDLSALDSSFRSSTMSDLEDADVSDLMTSMLDEVETNENQQQLVQWCIEALQLINRRFSNHHKSLFWLIKIYFRFTPLKNLNTVRSLLFGVLEPQFRIPQGLFQDKRPNNFFNGIFRVPADDIDRPGSFPAHMFRTVDLTVEFLSRTQDKKLLMELYSALKVQRAELESYFRRYLHDWDRIALLRKCHRHLAAMAEEKWNSMSKSSNNSILLKDFLLEIHTLYGLCDKTKDLGKFIDLLTNCHQAIVCCQEPSKTPKKDALKYCAALLAERQREALRAARQKRAKILSLKRPAAQYTQNQNETKAACAVGVGNMNEVNAESLSKRPRLSDNYEDPVDQLLKAISEQKKIQKKKKPISLIPAWSRTPTKQAERNSTETTPSPINHHRATLASQSPTKPDVMRVNGFPLTPDEFILCQTLFGMALQQQQQSMASTSHRFANFPAEHPKQKNLSTATANSSMSNSTQPRAITNKLKTLPSSTWQRTTPQLPMSNSSVPSTLTPKDHAMALPPPRPAGLQPVVNSGISVLKKQKFKSPESSEIFKTQVKTVTPGWMRSSPQTLSASSSQRPPSNLISPSAPQRPTSNCTTQPLAKMAKDGNQPKGGQHRSQNFIRSSPYPRPTVPKPNQPKGYQYGKNIAAAVSVPLAHGAANSPIKRKSQPASHQTFTVTKSPGTGKQTVFTVSDGSKSLNATKILPKTVVTPSPLNSPHGKAQLKTVNPSTHSGSPSGVNRSNFSVDFLAASSVRPDISGGLQLPLMRDKLSPNTSTVSPISYNCPLPTLPFGQNPIDFNLAAQFGMIPKLPVPPLKSQSKPKTKSASVRYPNPTNFNVTTPVQKPLKPLAVKPSSGQPEFPPYPYGLDNNLMQTVASQLAQEREAASMLARQQQRPKVDNRTNEDHHNASKPMAKAGSKRAFVCDEVVDLVSD